MTTEHDEMHDETSPIGFDPARIDRWLGTATEVVPPCSWRRLPGGHSNLTYELTDADGAQYVIRRPPQGDLLPKAHDMYREYRIIDALHPVGVPVARPVAYCDDRDVCERHFYVMEKVAGTALLTAEDVEAHLDEEARSRVGPSFIGVLADLHQVDPTAVGLGELGRHDGYVARQLRTWYGSWVASVDAAGLDDDRVHDLHERLLAAIPEQGPARVVHGDYGVHNALFHDDGVVAAVLDWEIATLGDPLADFAYALNAWAEPGDEPRDRPDPPTALPGFSARDDLVEVYAARTGADLRDLAYHRAFNAWKTACIIHGVYARYRRGQKSADGVDLDGLFGRIEASLDVAEEHASGIGR